MLVVDAIIKRRLKKSNKINYDMIISVELHNDMNLLKREDKNAKISYGVEIGIEN